MSVIEYSQNGNIAGLPSDDFVKIFGYLKDPRDRASLIMTCKKIYVTFSKGVKDKNLVDHRSIVRSLNERGNRLSCVKKIIEKTKDKPITRAAINVGIICSCVSCLAGSFGFCGLPLFAFCNIPSGPIALNATVYTWIGSGGCAIGSIATGGIANYCCEKIKQKCNELEPELR